MPGDPFRIFKDDPGRQETLKILWPALYECLATSGAPGGEPQIPCCLGDCAPSTAKALGKPRRRAVGRLTRNGHPACDRHIHLADKPGGWPLKRIEDNAAGSGGIVWEDD